MISKKNSIKYLKGLYVIIDPDLCKVKDPLFTAKEVTRAGAKIIQLRFKTKDDALLLKTALQIKKLCLKEKVLYILNDRADIAELTGADGLHLGQSDLPIREARKVFTKGFIGISTHTDLEVKKAVYDGADYIGFGPVFKTNTKAGLPPVVGLLKLKSIKSKVNVAVVAIGGINKDNIGMVFKTGADSSAVISSVCGSADPYSAVKELRKGEIL